MPSISTEWEQFKQLLVDSFETVEHLLKKYPTHDKAQTSSLLSILFDIRKILNGSANLESEDAEFSDEIGEPTMVVDITNILHLDKTKEGTLKVENIKKVHDAVASLGYSPLMIADASMEYKMDNKSLYKDLCEEGAVIKSPAGVKADVWVLKIAKEEGYKFIANDMYREYADKYGKDWIFDNRLTCMHANGKFYIQDKSVRGER
jgi:hypothetical protein